MVSILESRDLVGDLRQGADLLNGGGVIVLPTETVYGAAGRLDRPEAMARLGASRIRRRETNDDSPRPPRGCSPLPWTDD